MAEYTDDLALIVRYDGTKEAFEAVKSSYLGKVVFIYGSKTEVANQAGLVQSIWVSDETGGRYLDMANVEYISNNLTHISGITVDGKTYYPSSGGGAITLAGANGIAVTVNTTTGAVTFDGGTLKSSLIGTTSNNSNTTTHPDTIKGAKAYADSLKASVIGDSNKDDLTSPTIAGAKKYTDMAKKALEGTKADGDNTPQTIEGAKKYADAAVANIVSDGNDASTDDTIKGAKKYTDEAKAELLGESTDTLEDDTILGVKNYAKLLATAAEVSIVESEGTGDIGKVYTFYQGGTAEVNKIGVINTPKELVVKSGQVVVNPTGQPAGTYIELTIQNQDAPLYINVADLVDVYTAKQNAAEVQLAISTNNEISAVIKTISGAKIADQTITLGKLASSVQASLVNADTAYQKPADGIPKEHLANGVQTALELATNSIQGVATADSKYIKVTATDEEIGEVRTIEAVTAPITNETATTDGLATVADIRAYLAARLSVKVVS